MNSPRHQEAYYSTSTEMYTPTLDTVRLNAQGEPLTWGATPLVTSLDIKRQQDVVKGVIDQLFTKNIPEYITPEIATYISNLNLFRTANRETKNQDSFSYRRELALDNVPLESLDVIERAKQGFASPAELLYLSEVLGIATIELASLTHPYGKRIEHLEPMRNAVHEAIDLLGGVRTENPVPEFEVRGSDNLEDPRAVQGVHVTRENQLGTLPDQTKIVERSSFVLLLDNLPPKYGEKIRSLKYEEFWPNRVRRAENLYQYIPELLDNNQFDKAVPISTTVFALNEARSAELLNKEAVRQRQKTIAQRAISASLI